MTGLPANNTAWPPPGNTERYRRMRKHDAWYSGDADRLAGVYGTHTAQTATTPGTTLNAPGLVKRVVAAFRNEFWASPSSDEVDTKRHLPTPEDIARHSARLLFSERLQIRVKGPTYPADGPAGADGKPTYLKGDAMPETLAAQRRLDHTLSMCNFDALVLAAAEIASALGSTGLRIAFDKTGPIKDRPLLARVDADAIVPVYSWGQLVGVMFWQLVKQEAGDVLWRHIELHEGGRVYHGLYKGSSDSIGERVPLELSLATAHLAPIVDDEGGITILTNGGRTATSIPNMLPDPLDRSNNAGRSDYTPAVMDLFDAIDRVFSQMMDTIEDAKSRIIVSDSMLERGKPGQGVTFDRNQRIFTKVKVPPAEKEGGGLPIEKIQFEMHVAEYLSALDWLIRAAVEAAGYDAGTDVGQSGRDVTATEITVDRSDDMATRDTKIRYWQPELQALLTSYLAVDVEQFTPRDAETGQLVKAYPVEVTFPDAVQPTKLELANIAKALKDAGAASIYELVKTVNPDWTDAQISKDVERIMTQGNVIDPVSFGTAGAGVTPGLGI